MPLARAPVTSREVLAPSPTMKTLPAHPEVTVEEDGLAGVHLDLRIVHDGARVEDAGDDGACFRAFAAQMWRMIWPARRVRGRWRALGSWGKGVEILTEGLRGGACSMREIPDPLLHERPAAADLVGQPAEWMPSGWPLRTGSFRPMVLSRAKFTSVVACLELSERAWPLTSAEPLIPLEHHPRMPRIP